MNEWNDITKALNIAQSTELMKLSESELNKVEALLDHWSKMAWKLRMDRLYHAGLALRSNENKEMPL